MSQPSKTRSTLRSAKRDRFVASIDFGTTYSGSACTFKGKPDPYDQIPMAKGYRGKTNSVKVPTQLRYEIHAQDIPPHARKRKAPGADVPNPISSILVEWGFEVNNEKDFIQLVKLLLDPHQPLPLFASRVNLEAQLIKFGKSPIDTAADFLEKLKNHILDYLKRRFGETMVANTDVEYILTVPAVWSDAAKDATLKAAEKAGLGRSHKISLVTEPEAAALYAFKQIDGLMLRKGDIYIICDAGGGTVDLIAYEAKLLSPLQVEESVKGSGAICGSSMLNIRFTEHVKKRMGARVFDEFCQKNPRGWAQCVQHFEERTKRDFDPSQQDIEDNTEFFVPLGGAKDNQEAGIDSGYLFLTTLDLIDIFQPIIEQIFSLTRGQQQAVEKKGKKAKGVILVGGFGESMYLFKRLVEHFADVPDFSVLQPQDAWSAVARGAVIHCLEGEDLVRSRIARRHYGVVARQTWDPRKHSHSKKKVLDTYNDRWYADDQIFWYVTKGQPLPGDTIVMPFHLTTSEEFFTDTIQLVVSDEDIGPKEFDPTPKTRILCTITPSFDGIPMEYWHEHQTEAGKTYMQLDYGVGMRFTAGAIFFDMHIDDEVYGSAVADYE